MPQISLQKIYRLGFSNPRHHHRGFTLIEILIAIGIFVSSLTFILPQIYRSENTIKKNLRELQAINRTLYSYSRIRNMTYRLALKIDETESSYWVEVKRTEDEPLSEINWDESDPETMENIFFTIDQSILKTPRTLPFSMQFYWEDEPVENEQDNIKYITYDPHTFSPPTNIQIKKDTFTWNLNFNPLSGELEIIDNENT